MINSYIQEIPIERLRKLDYLRFDHHSNKKYEMTPAEYEVHSLLAKELLLLDFDCFLQIYFNSKSFLTDSYSSDDKRLLAKKLLTKNIQMLSLNIRAKHFFKLIYSLWNNASPSANTFMNLPYNKLAGLESLKREKTLNITFHNYYCFSQKWVHSILFWKIYARKHNQAITITQDAEGQLWQQFLNELNFLIHSLHDWMTQVQAIAAFHFWLKPLPYLPEYLQITLPEGMKVLAKKSAEYHPSIETEVERIGKMSEFVGSTYGCVFLWENRKYLSFPVFDPCRVNADSFEKELYERFSDAMVKDQSHPKYKLLVTVSQGKETLSYADKLTAFNYLLYYSGNLFKGHIAELFALTLVKQTTYRLFGGKNLVCIPGSAIKFGNQQGADGIIAQIKHHEEGWVIHVFGLIEVKAYLKSDLQLLAQLKKHEQRLREEAVVLFCNESGENGFFAAENGLNPNQKAVALNIVKISVDKNLKYIAVIPRRVKEQRNGLDELVKIFMPWTQLGIRQMSYQFMEWIITNLARIVDHGNYELGRQNWLKVFAELLNEPKLLNSNTIKQIKTVKKGLENGWEDADEHLH